MKQIEVKYELLSYFNMNTKQDVEPCENEHLYLVNIDNIEFVIHAVNNTVAKSLNFKDNVGFAFYYTNKPNVILKYQGGF